MNGICPKHTTREILAVKWLVFFCRGPWDNQNGEKEGGEVFYNTAETAIYEYRCNPSTLVMVVGAL